MTIRMKIKQMAKDFRESLILTAWERFELMIVSHLFKKTLEFRLLSRNGGILDDPEELTLFDVADTSHALTES